jgi:adenylate cyclase
MSASETNPPNAAEPDAAGFDPAVPGIRYPAWDYEHPADLAPARPVFSEPSPLMLRLIQSELEKKLLGEARRYNRQQVADRAGVPLERVRDLWRAMGFASSDNPEAVLYTEADVAAIRDLNALVNGGLVDRGYDVALTRALGQSFSRLAEWQVPLVNALMLQQATAQLVQNPPLSPGDVLDSAGETVLQWLPVLQNLHNYAWRRHLAATAARSLSGPGEDTSTRTLTVGFADMVGYTGLTRHTDISGLAELLERFESTVTNIIAAHHGWIIKNVGDEVMFAAESPKDAVAIAFDLNHATSDDELLPNLHIGMAYGDVLVRFGDLYGTVVNAAARLTAAARPGRALIDESLALAVRDVPNLSIRPLKSGRMRRLLKYKPHVLRLEPR